jgi:nucleoside-diphosphate-sugar epimerase
VILAVTGANGFIGSHLVPVLLAEGHRIAVINEPGIGGVPPNGVRSLTADITSSEGLLKTFADAEAVIHLAARNHVLKETAGKRRGNPKRHACGVAYRRQDNRALEFSESDG